MNKNILFVDYTYQKGHVNFNKIHIESLRLSGYNVKMILHRDIMEQLPFDKRDYALILPNFLKQRDGHPVINRISFLLALLLVKINVRIGKFDKVIVSCCDEVTLGLLPLCRNMYIICHNNAASFRNKIKCFFMKRLARDNYFVVFNKEMVKPFSRFGIHNVFVISHGCIPPFEKKLKVQLPINVSSFNNVIFHPSPRPDADFVKELTQSIQLNNFLSENNILLILRNKPDDVVETDNIKFINQYLSSSQYQYLFMLSDIILLAYPQTFEYRVSGVSFESVANGKLMLIKKNKAFNYCRDFFNYDPMFCDIAEFCTKLKFLISTDGAKCVVSRGDLLPDYRIIFND